jgi:hypothetical protein
MADNTPAIAGVQKCGCITYVNADPDHLNRDDEKALAKVIRNGGSIRHGTVAEISADPDFLNMECPHDPKGWEREIWEPKARTRHALGGRPGDGRRTLMVEVEVSKLGIWRLAGQVHKAGDGEWTATTGFFTLDGEAHDAESLGPFRLQREATKALIGPAIEAHEKATARA